MGSKFRLADFELRISDFNSQISDSHFNPKSEIQRLVEAPRIELGSKSQRRRTLHAYSLLFHVRQAGQKFARC